MMGEKKGNWQTEVKVRRAKQADCKNVFDLSNDPVVRRASFNQGKIKWKGHVNWFNSKLLDPNHLFFIVEDGNNFAGQIRYAMDNSRAEISISLSGDNRNRGIGSTALQKSISLLKTEKPLISEITAYIKSNNKQSLAFFRKNSFIQISENDGKVRLIYHFNEAN